jgi:hypothetical protein
MHSFTVLEVVLELTLGVCIKLFCDNGRIHWRDLVNDFLFWVPGLARQQLPADGLTRQVAAAVPFVEEQDETTIAAIAAK